MKKRDESKLNLFLHGNSRQVLKEINRIFNVKNSGLKPQSVFEFLSTPKMPLLSAS